MIVAAFDTWVQVAGFPLELDRDVSRPALLLALVLILAAFSCPVEPAVGLDQQLAARHKQRRAVRRMMNPGELVRRELRRNRHGAIMTDARAR